MVVIDDDIVDLHAWREKANPNMPPPLRALAGIARLTSLRQGFGGPLWLRRRRKASRSVSLRSASLSASSYYLRRASLSGEPRAPTAGEAAASRRPCPGPAWRA